MKTVEDTLLLEEIGRRLEQKNALIDEMEVMTKTLLEMNKKAEEAHKIQSKFMSLVKNELNNPLAALLMLSKNLRKKAPLGEAQGILEMLQSELLRMNFQLGNIFAAAEIEGGHNTSFYSVVSIDDLLTESFEMLHYVIKEKELKVEVQNYCTCAVRADRKKVGLILVNLLSNACEFSHQGGTINIEIGCDDTTLFFRFQDEGVGISEEDKQIIFEPFVRIDTPSAGQYHGLGLGLSVALSLAQSENGTLQYVPQERGAIFEAKIRLGEEEDNSNSNSEEFFEL